MWRSFPPFPHLGWETPPAKLIWPALALAAGLALVTLPLTLAAALVCGAIVLVCVLVEPMIGLALTLLAGPLGALESVILGGTSADSGQLLLALMLASWLAHSAAKRTIRLPRPSRPVTVAFIAFVAIGALSLLRAPSVIDGVKELAKWVQIGLVAWFVADVAGRLSARQRLIWAVAAVLLAGLSQALIGIWQFGLRGHGPEHFLILGRFYRAYGTFEQPNPFAGFLGLALPLALGVLAGLILSRAAGANWRQLPSRLLPALKSPVLIGTTAIAACLAAGLLMSWSRGAWLGAAAAVATMLAFLPRRRWLGWLLVAGVIAAGWLALQGGLLPGSITGRLTDFAEYTRFEDARGVDVAPENYAVLERMAHWQAALNMANSSPWLGVGFGNYEAAYPAHDLLNWPYPLGHAHNYYLNLLAETGVLGLLAYLGFWAAVFALTARVIQSAEYPARGLAIGLMGAWAHLSVHHLVDKLYVNNIYLHLGALLGILILLAEQEKAHANAH